MASGIGSTRNTFLKFSTIDELRPYAPEIVSGKIRVVYAAHQESSSKSLYLEGIDKKGCKVFLTSNKEADPHRLNQSDRVSVPITKEGMIGCYILGVNGSDLPPLGRRDENPVSEKTWHHFFGVDKKSQLHPPLPFEELEFDIKPFPISSIPPYMWLTFDQLVRFAPNLFGKNLILSSNKEEGPWHITKLSSIKPLAWESESSRKVSFSVSIEPIYQLVRPKGKETHAIGFGHMPWIQKSWMEEGRLFVGILDQADTLNLSEQPTLAIEV